MLHFIVSLLLLETIELASYDIWRPDSWIRTDCREMVLSSINPGEPVVAGGR